MDLAIEYTDLLMRHVDIITLTNNKLRINDSREISIVLEPGESLMAVKMEPPLTWETLPEHGIRYDKIITVQDDIVVWIDSDAINHLFREKE